MHFTSVGAAVGVALIGIPLYLAYVASISHGKKRRRRKRSADDDWFDHEEYKDRQNGTVETAHKVYVCPRGNLLYMRIYLITDLKFL